MEAKVKIDFKRIAGRKVDLKLLAENPKLAETTERTLQILCQKLKEYFKQQKIKINISYNMEN